MIKINDVTIKTPQNCTIGIQDIIPRGDRNAKGEMLIDRIATKRVLEMDWGALSNAECAAILSAITDVFFEVDYPDPQTGVERTIVCYARRRTAPMLKYSGSTPYWEGLSLTLEER